MPFSCVLGEVLSVCRVLCWPIGLVLSVVRVSGGLGVPCIVIGCCWAIGLFGNKFLLIQKKKKKKSEKISIIGICTRYKGKSRICQNRI